MSSWRYASSARAEVFFDGRVADGALQAEGELQRLTDDANTYGAVLDLAGWIVASIIPGKG